jgi:hypothetical protein
MIENTDTKINEFKELVQQDCDAKLDKFREVIWKYKALCYKDICL